jgi:Ankyrin repeats (many copies)/Ankyrin repeat
MRKAAIKGDTKTLTRLVIKGEPVYFDPRPWYLRDMVQIDNPEGDTPQNNPHVVQTDAKCTVPLDWFEPHDGMTAMMHACQSSTPESVRVLLEMGANPHRKNRFGVNSIDLAKAAMDRAAEALKARVRGAGEFRRRAAEVMHILDTRTIWETVRDGDKNRLRVLLNTGKADVNAKNPYGMTALHFAVINHDFEAVEMLVMHGGNPHAKNNLGQTPLTLTEEVERPGTKARLMEAFTGGKAEDAVRREKDRDRLTREAEERALLVQFERKLKTLTRGTTAAKTLRTLNKITKEAQVQAGAEKKKAIFGDGGSVSPSRPGTTRPGTRAASSPGGRRPATSASSRPATVSAARASAMSFATGMDMYGNTQLQQQQMAMMQAQMAQANQPPMSPFAMDRSRPETTWRNNQLTISMAEPVRYSGSAQGTRRSVSPSKPPEAGLSDGIYAASHQRHARAFVSLAMKEQQQAEARSLGAQLSRGVTEVSRHEPPSLVIRPGATDEELTSHAMEALAHAKAPHPADRKFDVYFMSLVRPDAAK